jgi:hypothetical protein
MATRNKLYYPKSHIVNNLFTSGKEWMYEDGTEFVGYYHRYIDGTRMSGAVYSRSESKKLIEFTNYVTQPDNAIYNTLKKKVNFATPHMHYPIPELEDYETGKMPRYFLRRRNLSSYEDIIEVDKPQFKLWKRPNSGINEKLYDGLQMDWKLTGPLDDSIESLNIVYGVRSTNFRMVQLKDQQFTGLRDFLTDYTELSIYSPYIDKKYLELFGNAK